MERDRLKVVGVPIQLYKEKEFVCLGLGFK